MVVDLLLSLGTFSIKLLCCREKELEQRVAAAAAAPEPDTVGQTPAHSPPITTNGPQHEETMTGLIACKVDYPFIMLLQCG